MKKTKLVKIIKGMAGRKVLVLGDLLVDEYIFGETSRISREAPVLILKFRERRAGCGGAANAVANIRALGGVPVPVGCIGDDENGHSLLDMFEADGIPTGGIIVGDNYQTTSKTRIMAGGMHTMRQQVIRIDREHAAEFDPTPIINNAKKVLADGVCGFLVSDYGCGVLSDRVIKFVNRTAGNGAARVAIDSRYRLKSYRNATLLAPNEEEAEIGEGTHADDLRKIEVICEGLRRKLKSRALLVTRGSEGLSLFEEGKNTYHVPVYGSRTPVDTNGAGDTVVATALLALCAGASFREAAWLANRSGGLVVMKTGAATISQEELKGTLE